MGASEPAAPLSPPPSGFSYEHEGDRQFATTLARGLEVLRCFTPLEPLLGNKEISVRTGLPKPTVSRLTLKIERPAAGGTASRFPPRRERGRSRSRAWRTAWFP